MLISFKKSLSARLTLSHAFEITSWHSLLHSPYSMSIHSDFSPLLWLSGFLSLIAGERVRAVAGELALHEFPAKYSLYYE